VSLAVGIAYFPTHDGIGPGPLAQLVEEHGYVALQFADHTHIPASRDTPYPSGGPLPRKYSHLYDLFVALTAAATATSRLRVGSCVCLIIERDPIVTAKQVASIDHLSGGRFDFGVGAGWNREEMRNHGTDPHTRMRVMQERVEAMEAIWTQEEASYEGEFVRFHRIWSWPKPLQQPNPPVLVGGSGATVLDRVVAFGDGWMPNLATDRLFERIQELRTRADRLLPVDVTGSFTDAHALAGLERAGIRRAMHWLPSGGRGVVERELERLDSAVAEFTGQA
jgi:probable F420-dependent oxidoreductase